jgi:hypothetical protein
MTSKLENVPGNSRGQEATAGDVEREVRLPWHPSFAQTCVAMAIFEFCHVFNHTICILHFIAAGSQTPKTRLSQRECWF